MKLIRYFLCAVGFFALVLNGAAFGAPAEIRVGVVLGLTGPADRWSKFQRMGIELAAEDLRKEGSDIRLLFEDSRTQPSQSVLAFNKLLAVDRVDAVLGDIFSHVTEPLIPLAAQKKKLLISPATSESFCTRSNGYFFSTATQISRAAEGFEYFLQGNPNVRKVALVYFQDQGWGMQFRDGWRKLLKSRGIEITDEFESADYFPDFKTAVLKLLRNKPDAFFVAHESKSFIAATRQLGFHGSLVFANHILEIAAARSDLRELEGIYFVDTLAPESFARRFEERFGEPLLLEAYNGYEALRAFVKAKNANPDAPEAAFPQMKYEGISGPMDFSDSCAGNRSRWHLKRFTAGKIELIR